MSKPRQTVKVSEIRAWTNRVLAGSDDELTGFRRGVAAMYEHIAMAANDYHGYNDVLQVWAGKPGQSAYVPDESYRRWYYGNMTGEDATAAQEAVDAFKARMPNDEYRRRLAAAQEARDARQNATS